MTSSASSSNCLRHASAGDVVHVPVVQDSMTFESRQSTRLKEMEKRVEAEIKKKKRDWEKQVERMREEFLELYPTDKVWGSDESIHDPLILKRRGSTDHLDYKKMKTLFLDYPDTGRRFKIRFNVFGYDLKTIRVTTDGDRIIVRATKHEDAGGGGGGVVEREFCRKIWKPKEVDHSKLKSYLTSDFILIVEAPLPPTSLNLRKAIHSPSHSHGSLASSRSRSPSNSPCVETPSSKEKVGVPIFREDDGHRRMHLVVEVGPTFKPHDITVQVIKENKILVKAKHEEKTIDRLSKSKFSKEYELGEKIETYSLTGGLSGDGKLVIGAFAKGHGDGIRGMMGGGGDDQDDGEDGALEPCNVLGRASAPAAAASSSSSSTR